MEQPAGGIGPCLATVVGFQSDDHVEDEVFQRPLPHLMRHSPDGFQYGYAGSGPADLARSIVGDTLDDPDPDPRLYQDVKASLLADPNLPDEIDITREQVLAVLDSHAD